MNLNEFNSGEWIWLGVGLTGQLSFSMRFLVRWISSEPERRSIIPVAYDTENAAKLLNRILSIILEGQGEPLVNTDEYQGQFHFLERLIKSFNQVGKQSICLWLKNHGHGCAVSFSNNRPPVQQPQTEYSQPYRNHSWIDILERQNFMLTGF